jgi:hypothetical protein
MPKSRPIGTHFRFVDTGNEGIVLGHDTGWTQKSDKSHAWEWATMGDYEWEPHPDPDRLWADYVAWRLTHHD